MKTLWKCTVIANVSDDPTSGATKNGKNMTKFRIGAKKDFGDEWNNATVFCYGKTAEFVSKYVTKGTKLYIEGSFSPNAYLGKDGKPVGSLNINATDIMILVSKRSDADDSGLSIPEGFTNVTGLAEDGLPF